jgi:hypothetical protein
MEAIKIIEQYWAQLKRLGVYAQYCAGTDIHAPACLDFWAWSALGAMALGLLIVGLIARRFVRQLLEFYRTKKILEARKIVASAEEMKEARWKDE